MEKSNNYYIDNLLTLFYNDYKMINSQIVRNEVKYMPKKLSDTEKQYIVKRLKEEALKCITTYGVKKTTVDELVKRVNIPKGTFYLFYASKELLLFDAINDLHDEVQAQLMKDVALLSGNITTEALTEFLFHLYSQVSSTGLLSMILNGELDLLMRKLPEDVVKEHLSQDDFNMEQLFSFLQIKDKKNIEAYSGAFRGIFLTMLHRREIGEQVFDDALKLMIRGLVIQIMEENENDKSK